MNISLEGRKALICGSTQGIGLAAARQLATQGATCILLARNEEQLVKATASLSRDHQQLHEYRVADFSRSEEVKKMADQLVTEHSIQVLVNNSGGPKPGSIHTAEDAEFTKAFEQHLVCNQLLAQALLPAMKQAAFGRIINIISTSVRTPLANLGVSNTIRAAVASWSKSWSNEVAQFGITVNSVLPGFTDTQRLRSLINTNAQNRGVDVSVIEKEMIAGIPARRFGQAEEIAAVIGFLASPAASFVNGISIPVDGGKTPTI